MNDMVSAAKSYCSEVAQQQGVKPEGTAVQVDCWLLVESLSTWTAKAVEDSAVADAVQRLTQEFAELGLKLRTQLIRQASSTRDVTRLYFADGRDGQRQLAQRSLTDMTDLQTLCADDLLALTGADWQKLDHEIYLVCTNGQRDVCCARFGRPLYGALHQSFGDDVWQTSHVGGHRYAPNLLCLPSGYMYGFVTPEQGVAVVEAHQRGGLTLSLIRGRSHYAAPAQAAEVYAREQHQIVGLDDLYCHAPIAQGDGWMVAYDGQASGVIHLAQTMVPLPVSDCSDKKAEQIQFRRLPAPAEISVG